MMKGHLTVARELYQEGESTAAQPHFGHPIHEHYDALEPAFEARGVEDVEPALQALIDETREGGEWGGHAEAYEAAFDAIDGALQTVDAELRDDVTFQSRVQLALLRQAMHEYEEAIDDGEFVNVVEYQDSFGFVQTAKALLEQHAELYDDETRETLLAAYDETLAAWPSAVAPASPVMTPGELSASLFKLEATLGQY
ncbi:hypothetical protein CVH10_16460 [Halomonas sp. ND22Bw]|uniref:hypothetical protein n=1 Tax=Halomonas sp. ND22Bw TaxID=2054178 RepID=UPI000D0BCA16|nr:hypothetical protein CVH10_16460 [Halomonas sp. ND22Bw]